MGMANNFSVKVVGVTYQSGYPQTIHDLNNGDDAVLVREPDNPHDSEAIRVTTKTNQAIGYIPAQVAKKLNAVFAQGKHYTATFSKNIDESHQDRPGVTLRLVCDPKNI